MVDTKDRDDDCISIFSYDSIADAVCVDAIVHAYRTGASAQREEIQTRWPRDVQNVSHHGVCSFR